MKKLCQFILCLCLCLGPVTALAASSPAPSTVDESGLVVLCVSKDSVRLRSQPDTESSIVAGLDSGAVVVAEKWPITGSSMSWYRVIALADKDWGRVTGALRAFPNAQSYPYVSAELVQPYSGELLEAEIIEGVKSTPYGMGYSALDFSADTQRRMAEQGTVKWVFTPDAGSAIPVYAKADTAADVLGHYSEKDWILVVVDDSHPGWLQALDLAGVSPSGWVEAGLLNVAPRDNTSFGREPGYLVTLNLGANVSEIMRRWAPATVAERLVEKEVDIYDEGTEYEEKVVSVSVKTRITAEGFELTYADCNNFSLTLTRPGSGLGGIFVGVDWCNKEYIERVFGKLSFEMYTTNDGTERCVIQGGPDGWSYGITLSFDSSGLVSEISYNCGDV